MVIIIMFEYYFGVHWIAYEDVIYFFNYACCTVPTTIKKIQCYIQSNQFVLLSAIKNVI